MKGLAFVRDNNKDMNTEAWISEVAFRYFLEKGYEATNLRQIADTVGIKAASVYFYFSSKKDLFLAVFNKLAKDQLSLIEEIISINQDLSAKDQLFILFRLKLKSCMNQGAEYKFLLRYKLFPVDEMIQDIRDLYNGMSEQEFKHFEPVLRVCLEDFGLQSKMSTKTFYQRYKFFENTYVNDMLISGVALSEVEIEKVWRRFWSSVLIEE